MRCVLRPEISKNCLQINSNRIQDICVQVFVIGCIIFSGSVMRQVIQFGYSAWYKTKLIVDCAVQITR